MKKYETLDCMVEFVGAESVKCDVGEEESVWIPMSVIDRDSLDEAIEAEPNEMVELRVMEWFLIDKGLV